MPRTYQPSVRKRYKKYDELALEAALSEYNRSNHLSFSDIAEKYGISKSVLQRHNTKIMKKHGGQTVLTLEVEDYIVENLNECSDWGYPLDTYELRLLIKGYLDRVGVAVRKFRDNMPGPDFVKSFLQRHKNKISTRICQNIKKCRAAVSPEIIEDYFKELEKTLEGVPLSNIVNYDETNLSDDPGRHKVLTKRGTKYPERVMNHSKSANSIMMAAAADGKLLPCYVVYKSANLYPSWIEKGPQDCRYNRTTSGWFDSNTFEDWVHTIALPYFDKLDGKKILIGDNLSSHLSIDLIKDCKKKNIHFVFLPANSTHMTQPLDVAFFRPVKMAWRKILFGWKKTEGRNFPTVPKSVFPRLLKKLMLQLEGNAEENIKAEFSKAGISPLNKNKVLERLPRYKSDEMAENDKVAVDETVLALLKELRYGSEQKNTVCRRKKFDIKAGKSVCLTDNFQELNNIIDTEISGDDSDDIITEANEHLLKNQYSPELLGTSTMNRKRKNELNHKETDDIIFKKPALPKSQIKLLPKALSEKNTVANIYSAGTENYKGEIQPDMNMLSTSSYIKVANTYSARTEHYKGEIQPDMNMPSTSSKYIKGKGVGKKSKNAKTLNENTTIKNQEESQGNHIAHEEDTGSVLNNMIRDMDDVDMNMPSTSSKYIKGKGVGKKSKNAKTLNENTTITNQEESQGNHIAHEEDTGSVLNNMIRDMDDVDMNMPSTSSKYIKGKGVGKKSKNAKTLNENTTITNQEESQGNHIAHEEDTGSVLNNMIRNMDNVDLSELDVEKFPVIFTDDLDSCDEVEVESCEIELQNEENSKLVNFYGVTNKEESQEDTGKIKDINKEVYMFEQKDTKKAAKKLENRHIKENDEEPSQATQTNDNTGKLGTDRL